MFPVYIIYICVRVYCIIYERLYLQSENTLAVWEGLYTEILNFYERPNTTFPVTLSLLKLLKRACNDKAFVDNIQYLTEVSYKMQSIRCVLFTCMKLSRSSSNFVFTIAPSDIVSTHYTILTLISNSEFQH